MSERRNGLAAPSLDLVASAHLDTAAIPAALGTPAAGLTGAAARQRLATAGPNTLPLHRASAAHVLAGQLRNPILGLLAVAAVLSFLTGDRADAVIILVILAFSIGIGFWNEFQAQRTADSLQSRISHTAIVVRDGDPQEIPVREVVPGDLVQISLGAIVPADLRLLTTTELTCDEASITGESVPAEKAAAPLPESTTSLGDLDNCALMGTVVASGSGTGIVIATGRTAQFGAIAASLATVPVQTSFQTGLARFSRFLLYVAIALTVFIFAANLLLQRPLLTGLMFALAIAVGITPQMLPAIVSTSLAAGARLLAKQQVLVKRLVCIEDLGNVDILVTDKTGTLTNGQVTYVEAVPAAGHTAADAERLALLTCGVDFTAPAAVDVGQNLLDIALAAGVRARTDLTGFTRLAYRPFDHGTRVTSAVIGLPDGTRLEVVRGAPEAILPRCPSVGDDDRAALTALFSSGSRVVSIATAAATAGGTTPSLDAPLTLIGHITFLDQPKTDAAKSLARLQSLNVTVKVATGDNAVVAEKVCRDLGLDPGISLTGDDVDRLDDDALLTALARTAVMARLSPQQKARIVKVLRREHTVAFMGDGVNDAPALHSADVGISVASAVDVAKQAADVVLLDKDLGVVADAVTGGRRVFTNTIKYIQMGTSSNFGNMFSAAMASVVLPFLPMTPGQILLNNLLYDTSQLAIPTDHVDEEQLRKPSHWDISQIRRFMLIFGPISSLFDFATFGILLGVLHAAPPEFQAGWFVESLATQTLIVFAIRTPRSPLWRSRPGKLLLTMVLGIVTIGAVIPYTPVADLIGFSPLPPLFLLAMAGVVAVYLVAVEIAKVGFYRGIAAAELVGPHASQRAVEHSAVRHDRRTARRAARF